MEARPRLVVPAPLFAAAVDETLVRYLVHRRALQLRLTRESLLLSRVTPPTRDPGLGEDRESGWYDGGKERDEEVETGGSSYLCLGSEL